MKNPSDKYIDKLKAELSLCWTEVFDQSIFLKHILEKKVTKELYALYLLETFQYTKHNALNQALCGSRIEINDFNYQRFCFHHAEEEVGHQMMALNDLKNIGYKLDHQRLPKPLPETTTLIAYLYWISSQGNPLQRLGYSFWAESCYEFIGSILNKVRKDLNLETRHMTFFVSHAEIDSKHAIEVEKTIRKVCGNANDYNDIAEVMKTSLKLTQSMMDSVLIEYKNFQNSESQRCRALSESIL